MIVKCPTCKKEVEFTSENRYRPFCSERCSTLDLGAWADEKYRVPTGEDADQQKDSVNENSDHDDNSEHDFAPKDRLN